MSEDVTPLIFDRWNGIDKQLNPYLLPMDLTDDALNVYGHGDSVMKRPGTRPWGAGSAGNTAAGPIVDITHFVTAATSPKFFINAVTTARGQNDYGGLAANGKIQYALAPWGDPASVWIDVTSTATRAGAFVEELVPCDSIIWRTAYSAQAERKITVATEAAVGAAPADECVSAEWHKRHLWHFKDDNNTSRFTFSDVDAPETYPAANIETVDPRSGTRHLRGGISAGEMMYVGSNEFTYMVTGSTAQSFRITRLPFAFGLAGRRAAVAIGGTVLAVAARPMFAMFNDGVHGYEEFDVVALTGGDFKSIGGPIWPLLQKASPTVQVPALSWQYDRARMAHWPAAELAVLVPNARVPWIDEQSRMLVFSTRPGGPGAWWSWAYPDQSVSGSERICSIINAAHDFYLGMESGKMLGMDWEAARDDPRGTTAVDIPAYVTTHWINRERHASAGKRVFCTGGQKSGGNWTLSYAVAPAQGQAIQWRTLRTFDPGNYRGVDLGVCGDVGAGSFIKYRIDFPADGVRCIMRSLVFGNKNYRRTELAGA